jgi:Zn finger protein HypA/HybF involved in hydrogenase expression
MIKEEAIRHIENIKPYVGKNIKDALNIAIKTLEQNQPKKGYWIMTYDYFTEAIDYKCSCCHEDSFAASNYCPNCGAEMEGVRNE